MGQFVVVDINSLQYQLRKLQEQRISLPSVAFGSSFLIEVFSVICKSLSADLIVSSESTLLSVKASKNLIPSNRCGQFSIKACVQNDIRIIRK